MINERRGVVFFHRNSSWYLPYVLYQAKMSSPATTVALIGENVEVEGIRNVPLLRYADDAGIAEFTRSFRYLSDNGYEYELFCYLRWFYLLCYMREYKLDAALYLDSDALLFSPLEKIEEWLGAGCRCALSMPAQEHESYYWCASGHASYWTRGMLEEFCGFALETYRDERRLEQYAQKRRRYLAEGVSDMTTLYLFWRDHQAQIVNSAVPKNGAVIDHNLNLSLNYGGGEYRTAFGIKKLHLKDGKPRLLRAKGKGYVSAHVLHCQGRAKAFIPLYYRGPDFPGKSRTDRQALKARLRIRVRHPLKKVFRLFSVGTGTQDGS